MAGDVWRWCQVHQKWLQDANVRATRSGLENDRVDTTSQDTQSSRSSAPPDCLEQMGKRPSGAAAATSRWPDDGQTLDPVPPSPRNSIASRNKDRAPEASPAALRQPASLPRSELGLGLPKNGQLCTDNETVRPTTTRSTRPVRWLFAETPMQNNNCKEDIVEGENWVTVFSSNPVGDGPGGGATRFGSAELQQVIKEFEKCGNIVERVVGTDGANWVQIQYQSSREAGQALMKSGLRLKGGFTVIVRSLDQRQRKQLLLDTVSRSGANAGLGGSSSFSYLPRSSGPVDIDAPAADARAPPKSSVSKFVDLVFADGCADSERDHQISSAGYIIPLSFEPGLYKELFKSQVHRCDAFVTPLCDAAATQPLYFEYPRKSVDPCEYAQSGLEELRDAAEEEVANLSPCASASFQPTGKSACGGSARDVNDFSPACSGPVAPECSDRPACRDSELRDSELPES